MADVRIDASDLNRLSADLAAAGARVGAGASAVVRSSAYRVEAGAEQFAPVDTGNLRNGIGTDFVGDGRGGSIEAQVGPTASYAPFVELGTSRMAPHAFLGPAFDRVQPDFVAALEQLAEQAL
jgi:HK97 gp10 family phage protein